MKPDDLIAEFRNSYFPRIAVTVDMIATDKRFETFSSFVRCRTSQEPLPHRAQIVVTSDDPVSSASASSHLAP